MTRAATLRSADDIIAAGLAQAEARSEIASIARRYAIAITPSVADLIASSNGEGIARQFMPDTRELTTRADERPDPIGDHAHAPLPGVVHRYADRALLKVVSVCPVYCRFCFRRESVGPGKSEALSLDEISAALAYFRATPAIREVIMTGGDPLILSPRRICELTRALASISHIKTLRWHTRMPVVDPARITDALVFALTAGARDVAVAIHANHAREFTRDATEAIARLRSAGVRVLSQSVLLNDVNDDVAALKNLMHAFAGAGVTPYYLHHGDLAPGTSHFRTTVAHGRSLMRKLASRLPPAMAPRYMLDIPGGYGKIDLMSESVIEIAPGSYRVFDRFGAAHIYEDGKLNG